MSKKKSPEASVVCPSCGRANVVPIVYGYPSSNLQQRASENRAFLGGCVVFGDDPAWRCTDCGVRWS